MRETRVRLLSYAQIYREDGCAIDVAHDARLEVSAEILSFPDGSQVVGMCSWKLTYRSIYDGDHFARLLTGGVLLRMQSHYSGKCIVGKVDTEGSVELTGTGELAGFDIRREFCLPPD